jgi:integrase
MQLNRVKVVASPTGWLTLYAWAGEERIRWSLGTKKSGEAENRKDWIVRCVSEGIESSLWPTLKDVLPRRTFDLLSELAGYKPVAVAVKVEPTWTDLQESYIAALDNKILEGNFTESSKVNYLQSLKQFGVFLAERGLSKLADINEEVVSDFQTWRKKAILSRNNSGKKAKRLSLDLTVLRAVWNHTKEKSWLKAGFETIENPWPIMTKENKPGAKPENKTLPFTGLELAKMRAAAETKTYDDSQGRVYRLEHGTDLLAFELLLRTGLRRCDAATIQWKSVRNGMLHVEARKNEEEILLPIHPDLERALRAERSRRNPSNSDTVLVNPQTGRPYDVDGKGLYRRINALGERVGIEDVRPHRFRDTFAVDALLKGAQPIEIARMLGDELETVVKHYLPLSQQLSQSTRELLARKDGGIEAENSPAVITIGHQQAAWPAVKSGAVN